MFDALGEVVQHLSGPFELLPELHPECRQDAGPSLVTAQH